MLAIINKLNKKTIAHKSIIYNSLPRNLSVPNLLSVAVDILLLIIFNIRLHCDRGV